MTIKTNLNTTLQYPNQVWSWFVTEFPADYTKLPEERCDEARLGKKLVQLDDLFGYLILPDNQTVSITTNELSINGENGLYGKGLLLKDEESNRLVCGSMTIVDKSMEKVAIANFNTPIAGNVHFRWYSTRDSHGDMLISSDLYHSRNVEHFNKTTADFTEHHWKIYVTDILDTDNDRSQENCNILQLVFDPQVRGDGKAIGDIDARLGKVKISTDYSKRRYTTLFRDDQLILLPNDLSGPQRRLYLVIFENKHPDSFLACAKIRYEHPITAK